MHRLGRLVRTFGFDVLIALAVGVSAVDIALHRGEVGAPRTPTWLAVPGIALVILPLVLRRRFPFGAPAATLLVAVAVSFLDGRLMVVPVGTYAAGMVAAFLLGNLTNVARAWTGLAIAVGGVMVIVANDPLHAVDELVLNPAGFGLLWLVGFAMRDRIERADAAEKRALRLEHEREADALRVVVEERTRIARELHDIVGHSVSVMTVQASGVRRLLRPEQEQEREALIAVERTGREALAEMRRVVGALRDPEDGPTLAPRPSLSRVDKLVAQARETGLAVDLQIDGGPVPLPAGVDLAAYRLVQEGLTNAIKHAAARRAAVRVRYDGDHVEIEVCDDGRGVDKAAFASTGGGHGLLGLHERVSIYGGELEAGPRAEGGFRLKARLPVTT